MTQTPSLNSTLSSSFDRSHELAVDLMARSMATYPSQFINLVGKRLEHISIEYAVHVRGIVEWKNMELAEMGNPIPFSIAGRAPAFQMSFRKCLNAIIHSKSIETIFLPKPDGIFQQDRNVQVLALKINTDRFENVFVPVFGIGYFFFSHVVDKIQDTGRTLQ